MPKIKGPAIFLAQFMRDEAPYDTMENIGKWVAGLGYKGVQIPGWDDRVIDLGKAAESKTYCDEFKGTLNEMGLEATEVAGYLAGQVLAVHPAYEVMFEAFHPPGLRGTERTAWATGELTKCILASVNMGLDVIPVLSGGFAWHTVYPWPQRPDGIIEEAFKELAARWLPLLDLAHDNGQVFAYELHPGSDIYDGATYEMFLDYTDDHPAACLNYDPSHFLLQQLDYIDFIRLYSERIKGFHVKDAEFRPTGRGRGLRWLPVMGWTCREIPFTRRWASGFHTGVHTPHRSRLRQLGSTGMGMLCQKSRARCSRGRAVYRQTHHRNDRCRL